MHPTGPTSSPDPVGLRQPLTAGAVAVAVGFTSSFAVVLTGLGAVGASPAQAASGLLALCLAIGLGSAWLSVRLRMPVTLAWSTPGAALLATTGAVDGGWSAAVGAFCLTGVLIVLPGLVPVLGRLVAAIPVPVAQAMLAGVLLPLCTAPVRATAESPAYLVPVLVVWLLLLRHAARWAAPGALVAALVAAVVGIERGAGLPPVADLLPRVTWTTPTLTVAAVVGVALPLWVVTMAAQNLPGLAVLRSFGYEPPVRPGLATSGLGTVLAAPLGGHAVNLAAITAALTASPDAHPDPARRWTAGASVGGVYLGLAGLSTALAAIVVAAPAGVVTAAAGLALVPTLAASLRAALEPERTREAAVVAVVVAASGVTVAGIGGAFWGLVAGLVVHVVVRARRPAAG